MAEQILWLGEGKLELKSPSGEIVQIADKEIEVRTTEERDLSQAAREAKISSSEFFGIEPERLREVLGQDVQTKLQAPFTPYAETLIDLLNRQDIPEFQKIFDLLAGLDGQIVLDLGSGLSPDKM